MKIFKIVVASSLFSVIFSALFAILAFYGGVYFDGINNYGWDAYWIIFWLSLSLCAGCAAMLGLIKALMHWVDSDNLS